MPNLNTFQQVIGSIPALANISTTETAFVTVAGGTTAAVLTLPSNLGNAIGTTGTMLTFGVRAVGYVTTATSTNFTPAIYLQTSATLVSGNKLSAVTAVAVNTAKAPFVLELDLVWDSLSQKLNGSYISQVNGTVATAVTLTNVIGTLTATSSLTFICSALFSSGNAANAVTLTEFSAFSI